MKTFTLVNIKGGVGKTVSSVSIATYLSRYGKVLTIDCDAQGNLSQTFNKYDLDLNGISHDLIKDNVDNLSIYSTEYKNIDVLPSNLYLADVEGKLILEKDDNKKLFRLSNILSKVKNKYDYCVIDCAPSLSIITINALIASNEVLVPLKIDQYSLDGLGNLVDTITAIRKQYNPNLVFKGCFITMDVNTKVNKLVKEQLKEMLGDKMLNTSIRNCVKIVESTFYKKPIMYYDNDCTSANDYKELVKELIGE